MFINSSSVPHVYSLETSCSRGFGRGDERRTLYVTARANLFRIKTLMDGFHPFEK